MKTNTLGDRKGLYLSSCIKYRYFRIAHIGGRGGQSTGNSRGSLAPRGHVPFGRGFVARSRFISRRKPAGWRVVANGFIKHGVDISDNKFQKKTSTINFKCNDSLNTEIIDLSEDNIRPQSRESLVASEPMCTENSDCNLNDSVEIISKSICTISIKTEPVDPVIDDEIVILSENISGFSIKTEPVEVADSNIVPMPINHPEIESAKLVLDDDYAMISEMKNDVISSKYADAVKAYKGKPYRSSIAVQDIVQNNVKGFLISTSTLAGLFEKKNCNFGLNVIEAPGAKIEQLEQIVKTELICCENQEFVHVVTVFGLNDFNQNVPLSIIQSKVTSYIKTLKSMNANIQCNFIQLPLPPRISYLPDNLFPNYSNRTAEILFFNQFLTSCNDTRDLLSMERLGIQSPECFSSETWICRGHFFLTGRKHLSGYWRPSEPLFSAMHLHDRVRKKFWKDNVLPYFQKYLI